MLACPITVPSSSFCAPTATFFSLSQSESLDGVCDVEDELHVHGSLWDTSAASMNDGDQGAVQLVHVALREEFSSRACLVLHLVENTQRNTH